MFHLSVYKFWTKNALKKGKSIFIDIQNRPTNTQLAKLKYLSRG